MSSLRNPIFDRRRFDDTEDGTPPPASGPGEEPQFVPFVEDMPNGRQGRRDPSFRVLFKAQPPEPDVAEPGVAESDLAESDVADRAPTGPEDAPEQNAAPDIPGEVPEAEPPAPVFTEADIEAARQAGYGEGMEAGRAAAGQESAARSGDALDKIADGLNALNRERTAEVAEAAEQAVHIGVAVIDQLFPTLRARIAEREVQAFIAKHLADAGDTGMLVVQVHETLVEGMTDHMHELAKRSGFSGAVSVRADASLEPGDARLDWREGGVERLYEGIWTGVRAALVRAIGPLEPSPRAMAARPSKPAAKRSNTSPTQSQPPQSQPPQSRPATRSA